MSGPGAWNLVYEGYDPAQEPLREALCVLGNGYLATRGAAPETNAGGPHYPGTYIAGLYNRLSTDISGRTVENEDLVNAPNWLSLGFRHLDGEWFSPDAHELLLYLQDLDIRRGVLTRNLVWEDAEGRRTRVTQRRLVHMRDPHIAALQTTFAAENWSGGLLIRTAIDGNVTNSGVARYRSLDGRHLEPATVWHDGDDVAALAVETVQSRIRVAMAARTELMSNGDRLVVERSPFEGAGVAGDEFVIPLEPGRPVTMDKVVAVHTSRDRAISAPDLEAVTNARNAGSFDELLESHTLAWDHLWRRFRLHTESAETEARALNLHVFHLLQTVSKHSIDMDVGVPARGLHGEAYRGHVFWDELFIFPFLNLHLPDLTRSLLLYRFRRLREARWNAAAEGLDGALFPWQSGSNGREESQVLHLNPKSGHWLPDNSRLQRHVNIAIAYNVWQYHSVTGDLDFLAFHGAELMVEISRMLAALARYNRSLDRYEILGVMGPDEYHDAYPGAEVPGLDNNAYTNVMTVWVLRRTLEALDGLPVYRRAELWEKLRIRREELERWEDIAHKMRVVFHDGVISQFEGYGDLEELDWTGYAERYGNIQRLDRLLEAEGDTPNRYKLSKQADVLMLFYLLPMAELRELFESLGYELDEDTVSRTIEYYDARTSHGSTLSRVVHSWILARVDRKRSWELFRSAVLSDVADIQGGTTPEGIHLGAMAGTVDLVQRGYTGLVVHEGVLQLDPVIPPEIGCLECHVQYQGMWLDLTITQDSLTATSEPGAPADLSIEIDGQILKVSPGATESIRLS